MSHKWTPEEDAKLEEVCGDRPWPLAVRAYNIWATVNKRPNRTPLALERRAQKHGIYRKAEGDWITLGAVSRILELDRATPLRWAKRGIISTWRHRDHSRFMHYVHRHEFRRLAQQQPAFFRPYKRDALVMLFDSEELADWIYEQCPEPLQVRSKGRPVQCVETGKKYDSIKAAAKAVYVTPPRLRAVLDTTKSAAGLHWRSLAPPSTNCCATLVDVEASRPTP